MTLHFAHHVAPNENDVDVAGVLGDARKALRFAYELWDEDIRAALLRSAAARDFGAPALGPALEGEPDPVVGEHAQKSEVT